MSGVAIGVVAFIAVATVLAVIATIAVVTTHLKHLAQTLKAVRTDVEPELERLQAAADVARAELGRVSDAAGELREQREARRYP